jgi:hypothetical protein
MKKTIFIICVAFLPVYIFGQKSDSLPAKHFPRHYISINPINSALLDQVGIGYEYKPGILGFGLAAGYKYASQRNYSRFFIAASANRGAYEYYSGFYIIPQVNFYFYKPRRPDKGALLYFSLKGIYKYLQVDSTNYHIWDNSGGDSYYFYRKQLDKVNITGVFGNLGIKAVIRHFFFDINIGPGIIKRDHNMLVAGEGHDIYRTNMGNVNPPRKGHFSDHYFTVNISINVGADF